MGSATLSLRAHDREGIQHPALVPAAGAGALSQPARAARHSRSAFTRRAGPADARVSLSAQLVGGLRPLLPVGAASHSGAALRHAPPRDSP